MTKLVFLITLIGLGLTQDVNIIPSKNLRRITFLGNDPNFMGNLRNTLQNRFRPNPNPFNNPTVSKYIEKYLTLRTHSPVQLPPLHNHKPNNHKTQLFSNSLLHKLLHQPPLQPPLQPQLQHQFQFQHLQQHQFQLKFLLWLNLLSWLLFFKCFNRELSSGVFKRQFSR